jgi:hypothetical protein
MILLAKSELASWYNPGVVHRIAPQEPAMLQAHSVPEIPAETERIARLVFPKSSLAMKLRDELGMIYADEQFSDLFPERGQPAESPARLALVTVLQFAEG